ncbi:hypothetical protein HJC99_02200 [Candidatus Saccharibacteria bacterium]|nr:hypothetical protein [Candidatus Saccharibacteria bacterium]
MSGPENSATEQPGTEGQADYKSLYLEANPDVSGDKLVDDYEQARFEAKVSNEAASKAAKAREIIARGTDMAGAVADAAARFDAVAETTQDTAGEAYRAVHDDSSPLSPEAQAKLGRAGQTLDRMVRYQDGKTTSEQDAAQAKVIGDAAREFRNEEQAKAAS